MFGFRYIKVKPSEYLMQIRKGKIRRQGTGLSFFYHAPSSSLVLVPMESRDTPFIFQESSSDFQSLDVQGQITYRVTDAPTLARMLDFSLNSRGQGYAGDGLTKLPVRLTNLIQIILREKLQSLPLRKALVSASELVSFAKERLKVAPLIRELGLEVLDFSILSIKPTPEISKALEASARENLLKEADDAIYKRRNFAVEQERRIRENELQTQIAVEEKNRLIREEKMNAEIAVQEKQKLVEEARMNTVASVEKKKAEIEVLKLESKTLLEKKKGELVKLKSENAIEEARAEAEAMKQKLSAISALPAHVIEALVSANMDSGQLISKAIRDLASNAEKIGSLNLSPELLQSLLHPSFEAVSQARQNQV